jgi:succinate dehydrogenase / fumarate reductase flavoprotein subunit
LGASALMQGLADGYFILPTTVSNYLATQTPLDLSHDYPESHQAIDASKARIHKLMNAPEPLYTPDEFHRKLGRVLWNACGMAREKASLESAVTEIQALRKAFWQHVKITGTDKTLNQTLERAGRIADFFELGELMCLDALAREESCGCHARTEHITPDGEAQRHDDDFSFVSAWQFSGNPSEPVLHKEELHFEFVRPTTRNYK